MRKKVVSLVVAVVAVALFSFACAPTSTPAPEQVQEVELLGGSGSNYYTSVAAAEILNKYDPYVRVSALETASTQSNAEMSRAKDPNAFLMNGGFDGIQAFPWMGLEDFEGKEPITDLRWICALNFGHHAWVTLDPKIKSMKDFDGKSVAIMPSLALRRTFEIAFELLDVDVEIKSMGFSDQYNALKDGLVAGCLWLSTGPPGHPFTPVPPLQQLAEIKDVYAVPFPHELKKDVEPIYYERFGYPKEHSLTVALPGSLPTQTEPMEVFSCINNGFLCKADADEELIYEITRTLVEHYSELGEIYPGLQHITPELMVQLMPLECLPRSAKTIGRTDLANIKYEDLIHPGALKYYKEIGLWPEAWDARDEVRVIRED